MKKIIYSIVIIIIIMIGVVLMLNKNSQKTENMENNISIKFVSMENIEKIWNNIIHTNVVNSIVIVFLGLILYKFVVKILDKGEENDK